ncbi:MAG: hypothetical protein KKA73_13975 [Chloroflexi bacterium]|nr:hypothetical protein [Chloroflexota bacterium]MBU1748792.1 hypothetical protein [Chloroflexota bacterium]
MVPDDEISVPKAAQMLDLTIPYVLQLLRDGTLPGRRDKRCGWLTTPGAVQRYRAQRARSDAAPAREAGQTLVFLLLLLPVFFAFVGFVVDGGYMFLQYRRAYATANGAAQAAAQAVDRQHFIQTNEVILNPANARTQVYHYVELNGHGSDFQILYIGASQDTVYVDVRTRLDTIFMKLAGIDYVTVALRGTARPAYGIRQEGE